jgi:hypothetical protein
MGRAALLLQPLGQAANAGNGAWLTWPGGLQPLVAGMERAAAIQRMAGRWCR